jgi:hypothetical protein
MDLLLLTGAVDNRRVNEELGIRASGLERRLEKVESRDVCATDVEG